MASATPVDAIDRRAITVSAAAAVLSRWAGVGEHDKGSGYSMKFKLGSSMIPKRWSVSARVCHASGWLRAEAPYMKLPVKFNV